ncbi:MAG: xylulokinase [Planctomycetaceae bacterium]|jgi:xylulokinase|nr:xylulokinase [Planctomycetaceae bacterium]
MSVFLGIDIGTSGTKTLAIDGKGKILADNLQDYPCYAPKPLWSEQDPEDWWQATVKSVRNVIKKGKIKPNDVKAIGLSGQMHGSVFLDKNGSVIRKAILWNDQRTVKECDEITKAAGGRDELIKLVSNPAITGFTAPKILWLRNNEPRNYEKIRKILLPKDEIRRRLTGEYATDVSDASGMLLLNIAKRNWSIEMLNKLKLDREFFGKVYESEDVTGNLTSEAAKLLGLTTDCIVVGGAGDCAAGAIGNGIVGEGILSTSIGTSGVMFVYSDNIKTDPSGRVHTFCHAVRGKWHLMGVTLAAGGSLQWFRNAVCQELFAASRKKKIDVYNVLSYEAEKTPAGSEGLFFLPYLSGERTPHADPFARGCFIGLTLAHSRGHLVRSVMEGVTFSLRDSLDIFENLGISIKQIRATGGGAKSPFWRQIQADVFGQKVVTINSEEGPAFGAALLAAVGAGEYKNIQEACKATIKIVKETKPDMKTKKIYDKAMPIYRDLYNSLKDNFKKIGGTK